MDQPINKFSKQLLEKYGEYLDQLDISETNTSLKLSMIKVKPEYRDILKAVTHVDGTARVQTVHKNTLVHQLLLEFEKLSENILNNLWESNVTLSNGAFCIPDSIFENIIQPNILLYYCLKKYGLEKSNVSS